MFCIVRCIADGFSVADSLKAMYIQFYHHMQSSEYKQDLQQQIAVETVRIVGIVSCQTVMLILNFVF